MSANMLNKCRGQKGNKANMELFSESVYYCLCGKVSALAVML